MSLTRGVLFVHSAPSALCPHVEWAAAGVLGVPTTFDWTPQPADRGTYRTEHNWTGPVGAGAQLTSVLERWGRLRFEITEDPTTASEGMRWMSTPRLGLFSAVTGLHGDIVVPEERLRGLAARARLRGTTVADEIDAVLGTAWDAELDVFRHAGEGAPVRWLHQVV
jgi:hypothetical protein